MKEILLFLWQLPQNIIGLFLVLFSHNSSIVTINNKSYKIYFVKYLFNSGVSLGNFIIFDIKYKNFYENPSNSNYLIHWESSVKHEYGHQIQSKIFGIFYLIVIGIPSIFVNIFNRLFHKKWSTTKRNEWYYNQYPEKQADRLGGVVDRKYIF